MRKNGKVAKETVTEAGVAADIEKVTDLMKIAVYGIFGTPALNRILSAIRACAGCSIFI